MLPVSEILNKIDNRKDSGFDGKYYLVLVISDRRVQGGIWGIVENKGKLYSCGSVEGWSGESAEELIVAADASIATAVSKMPQISGRQPTEVLLGLPEQWVKGDGLKIEKNKILKTVCKKLLLNPVGFIVTPEAISHLIKYEEEGNPDLILVLIEESEIIVSLVSKGKFMGSKIVGRSDSLALDLEEGLIRFDFQDNFPNRILLLGTGGLEESRQSLIAYPWLNNNEDKKLSFLHLPKVDLARENLEISAVIYGGSKDLAKKDDRDAFLVENEIKETAVEETGNGKIIPNPEVLLEKPAEEIFTSEFGFIEGEDIAQKEMNLPPKDVLAEKVVTEVEDSGPETEVNNIEKPKRKIFNFKIPFKKRKENGFIPKNQEVFTDEAYPEKQKKSFGKFLKKLFVNKYFLGLVIVLAVIFVLFYLLLTKVMKSEVKLMIKPAKIEGEFDFTVSTKSSSVNKEKMILPAKEISVDVSGEKESEVQGRKTIGEKATGEVITYNRTDQQKTIPKGQVVYGPSNLKYIFVEEIKVASKTANLDQGVDKWGESRATLQAVDIGPQYNIESNTNLVLENVSSASIIIKNPTAFSGGTSREIQAVSKEDRDNLQKQLSVELSEKALNEIKGKISQTDHLLSDNLQVKLQTSRFNHEIGDEAGSLTLQQNTNYSSLYFNEDDILQLAENKLSSLPDGYQTEAFKQETNFSLKDKNKNLYTASVIKYYYPALPEDEIVNNLSLKTFSQIKDFLKNLSTVEGYEIMITPSFLSKLKIFPLNKNNIKIEINSFIE